MPRPLSRTSALQKTETRPITAPPLAVTGIPRPQASRLPMPRLRFVNLSISQLESQILL